MMYTPPVVRAQNAVSAILLRHEQYRQRFAYPGDYGERAFRYWLLTDLIHEALGWRNDQLVAGEVFDLILVDRLLAPVITIETKYPHKVFTKQDRISFKTRLHNYPSLQYAIMTNGVLWHLQRLASPNGNQQLLETTNHLLTDESFDEIINVLDPKRYT